MLNDMSPETLYEVIEPYRADMKPAGKVVRCQTRGCLLFGTFAFRDGKVALVSRFKMSPAKAQELGIGRESAGLAWIGATIPAGTTYGCDHEIGVIA